MSGAARESGVRLAELVATLSLAADLGLGQPSEHAVRSGLVALGLGDRAGVTAAERTTTFWVNLLAWVGCTADSYELSRMFGDDIELRADSYRVDLAGLPQLRFLLRHLGAGQAFPRRVTSAASLVLDGGTKVAAALQAHCEVTARLASGFELDPAVQESLRYTFARWDGKGLPAGAGGDALPVPARLLHLADVVVAHHRLGGNEQAVAVSRARRATQFDPTLVDLFCDCAGELLGGLDGVSAWDELLDDGRLPSVTVDGDRLDRYLEVLADFADLKSPFFLGHSRGVAALAALAADAAGRSAEDIVLVRRAGLVHDLGRAGVPNTIWDKPGPLAPAELERARMHDYFTDRILQQTPALARIGEIAAAGHERADGSGYPRRTRGASNHPLAAVLAAADAYQAMTETRPHRPALTPKEATDELRAEVGDGRLDGPAVEAVLAAAGHAPRRTTGPAGLTPREVEVLVLVARGASNRQVAQRLGITPRTAGSHIEHIYTKLGISTRAAAALFAVQSHLIPSTGGGS